MAPRAFLVLGVLMAVVLLISSEVPATASRELLAAENSHEDSKDALVDTKQLGGGCHHGCCGGWHGYCRRCCAYEGEVEDTATIGDEKQRGHGCHHGCCRWHHGHCQHCCSYKGEPVVGTNATAAGAEAKPHN